MPISRYKRSAPFWVMCVAICLAGFFLRANNLMSLPIFVDEASHIERSRLIATGQNIFAGLEQNKWLYGYILAWLNPGIPLAIWIGRLVSGLSGMICIAICVSIATTAGGRRAGLAAGAIYAVLPLATFHERQALVDPLMTAAASVSIPLSISMVRKPLWWHGVAMGLLFAISRLTKPAMFPYLAVPGLVIAASSIPALKSSGPGFAANRKRLPLIGLWIGSVVFALGSTQIVYLVAAQNGVVPLSTHTLSAANTILGIMSAERITSDLLTILEIIMLYTGPIAIGLAVVPLVMSVERPARRLVWLMALLAILFALVPVVAIRPTLTGEIASRYLLPAAIPLSVMAGFGYHLLADVLRKQVPQLSGWSISLLIVLLLTPGTWFTLRLTNDPYSVRYTRYDKAAYFTRYRAIDFDMLAAYLAKEERTAGLLMYPTVYVPMLEMRLDKPLRAAGGTWPLDRADIQLAIGEAAASRDSTFTTVLFDPVTYDPQHEVQQFTYNKAYPFREEQWIGLAYVRHYATSPPAELPTRVLKAMFEGSIMLESVSFEHSLKAGAPLRFEATWQTIEYIADSFKVFTHVVNTADESILAQHDNVPMDGLRPLNTWEPGAIMLDRYAIEVPVWAEPGSYQVRIGLYHPQSGLRLRVEQPGYADADFVIAGYVQIKE